MDERIYVAYGEDALELGEMLLNASGAKELFRPGMSVAVKPNLVVPKPASSGATTHRGFAEAVLRLAKDCGVQDLRIIEGAWLGADTRSGFQAEGYDDLAKRYGAKLVDLKKDTALVRMVDGQRAMVCQSAVEVDCLVNLPVLKAHCQTRMTCAIKNLKGCIPDSEKRRYHAEGLHWPISCLPGLVPTAFTLVDGLCGDLTFEEGGTPMPMHRAFLCADPVRMDAYAAAMLGLSLGDVPYIGLAQQHGHGSAQYGEEDVVALNQPQGKANLADRNGFARVARLTRGVQADGACSACYGSLVRALSVLDEEGITPKGPIHIGQGYKGKQSGGIGIGRCCAGFSACVPGCPPTAEGIVDLLRRG